MLYHIGSRSIECTLFQINFRLIILSIDIKGVVQQTKNTQTMDIHAIFIRTKIKYKLVKITEKVLQSWQVFSFVKIENNYSLFTEIFISLSVWQRQITVY
jgi:hypothetical protein